MKKLVFNTPTHSRRGNSIFSPNRKKENKPRTTPGAVNDRYPVILDDGKTIIYITDRSKEREIRERYAS